MVRQQVIATRATWRSLQGASLHAELWDNEGTGEDVWALVALRDGWFVPDGAIEEAVLWRATSGRSPWAEPELLPEPWLDDAP
jgi:hypothetical protein